MTTVFITNLWAPLWPLSKLHQQKTREGVAVVLRSSRCHFSPRICRTSHFPRLQREKFPLWGDGPAYSHTLSVGGTEQQVVFLSCRRTAAAAAFQSGARCHFTIPTGDCGSIVHIYIYIIIIFKSLNVVWLFFRAMRKLDMPWEFVRKSARFSVARRARLSSLLHRRHLLDRI